MVLLLVRFSPRAARAPPSRGLAFSATVAEARAHALYSRVQSRNQHRVPGVGVGHNVVPLNPVATRPQDLFSSRLSPGGT